ncbi:MAG: hypothetical protein QOF32_2606, partial [Gammaproteobacteria bacterium]|nr:hypothetical protein [Gammaproteobacteria bacterium]
MEKEKEIDVVSLFWIVWDQKYLVLAVALLGGAYAAFLALRATPMYQAQVTVTEVRDSGLGGGGSLVGQLGGLASVAGLSLGSSGADAERSAILQSRGLVEAFVKHYNLVPLINGNANLKNPEWYAVERFRRSLLDMHEDKLKGTTTIAIEWSDPVVAARWANDFVGLANELLRSRTIEEATRNIEYLNKQLAQTKVV